MLRRINPLAGTRINLFPLVFMAWVIVVYMLIVGNLSWYLWLFVGFIFLERMIMQVNLWFRAMIMREMSRRVMEEIARSAGEGQMGAGPGPLGPPPRPLE